MKYSEDLNRYLYLVELQVHIISRCFVMATANSSHLIGINFFSGKERKIIFSLVEREHWADDANRLHTHRRSGLPKVWRNLSQTSWTFHHHIRQGSYLRHLEQLVSIWEIIKRSRKIIETVISLKRRRSRKAFHPSLHAVLLIKLNANIDNWRKIVNSKDPAEHTKSSRDGRVWHSFSKNISAIRAAQRTHREAAAAPSERKNKSFYACTRVSLSSMISLITSPGQNKRYAPFA